MLNHLALRFAYLAADPANGVNRNRFVGLVAVNCPLTLESQKTGPNLQGSVSEAMAARDNRRPLQFTVPGALKNW
jgi:hypothetical protein